MLRRNLVFVPLVFLAACTPDEPRPVAVNPQARFRIAWCTYLGGPQFDQLREVMVLADGSILVGGQASSEGLPVTPGAVQPHYAGDDQTKGKEGLVGGDCYLARLAPDGSKVIAATYFGGSRQERNVYGMALDKAGNVVITSATRSSDIPTTKGCFQPKYAGGKADWFVAKLTPDLTKTLWCTYVGGSGEEFPRGGLALDLDDNVVVVGPTPSPDFPVTEGAYQRAPRGADDVGIVKLKADGSGLIFGTRVGGSGDEGVAAVAVAPDGTILVGGHTASADFPVSDGAWQTKFVGKTDSFVLRLSGDGRQLIAATFLGGSGNEYTEHGMRLAPDGTVLTSGGTASPDLRVTAGCAQAAIGGADDGFLGRFSADLKTASFLTFLGGAKSDDLLTPVIGPDGNIWAVGFTGSTEYKMTADALQPKFGGGSQDGLVVALTPDGSRVIFATFVGGDGEDIVRNIAFGPDGAVYLVGGTKSRDFPVTAGAAQTKPGGNYDGFVMKLVPAAR